MTDTIQVQDLYTGSGSLDSHTPGTIASGTATYQTPSGYVLTGTGGVEFDIGTSIFSAVFHLNGSTINPALGLYWEADILLGRYGGTGTSPPSSDFDISVATGDLAESEFTLYGVHGAHPNRIYAYNTSLGYVDVAALPATGSTVTLRVEVDPYAKTTTYFVNGSMVATNDDTGWYTGMETFAPCAFLANTPLYTDTGGIPGGTVQNIMTRFEIGTLGLGGGSVPPWWGEYVNSFEIAR